MAEQVMEEGLLCFRGTDREIGYAHGSQLRERVLTEFRNGLENWCQSTGQGAEALVENFLRRHQAWCQRHLPRVEAEVQGLAEGAGLTYAQAFFASFQGGSYPVALGEGCTAFYCGREASRTGHRYLGQTKDTNAHPSRYAPMRLEYEEGPSCLILNYPGWLANLGMNAYGIGFTGNSRYSTGDPTRGKPLSFLKKAILNARRLEEVRELLEAYCWEDAALLIASAEGGGFCAEFVHGTTALLPTGEGSFAHSNTILSADARHWEKAPVSSPTSQGRMEAARAFLAAKAPHDRETLKALMHDHSGTLGSVCLHPGAGYTGSSTAAMVMELTSGEVEVVIGQPCENPWRTYRLAMERRAD